VEETHRPPPQTVNALVFTNCSSTDVDRNRINVRQAVWEHVGDGAGSCLSRRNEVVFQTPNIEHKADLSSHKFGAAKAVLLNAELPILPA
jgi:hypothetical protein